MEAWLAETWTLSNSIKVSRLSVYYPPHAVHSRSSRGDNNESINFLLHLFKENRTNFNQHPQTHDQMIMDKVRTETYMKIGINFLLYIFKVVSTFFYNGITLKPLTFYNFGIRHMIMDKVRTETYMKIGINFIL